MAAKENINLHGLRIKLDRVEQNLQQMYQRAMDGDGEIELMAVEDYEKTVVEPLREQYERAVKDAGGDDWSNLTPRDVFEFI